MDVTLLGNYPHDEQESMARYAEMLKNILIRSGCRVEMLRLKPFFGCLKRSGHGLGKWLGYIDKFLFFPFVLRRHIRRRRKAMEQGGTFLVHICDHSNAMYTRWLWDVPHLVTCHDVLAIQSALGLISEHRTGWTGRLLQRWILSGLKRARFVICVSGATQKDLLALAPELKDRSCTIENPLNYPYAPMPPDQARRHLSDLGWDASLTKEGEGRFIFHVGGNQWYKNREGVIRIFGCLRASIPEATGTPPLKLVMAGKPPTDAMRRLVGEKGLAGRVVFVTRVSNEQLCALYSMAEALVFPSLKEGFGWPLLEAQACGCPVVTSDRPPMNEVGGPAALLANPENETEFARQIWELLSETPVERQRRKAAARQHAEGYDSEAFGNEISRCYRKIILIK